MVNGTFTLRTGERSGVGDMFTRSVQVDERQQRRRRTDHPHRQVEITFRRLETYLTYYVETYGRIYSYKHICNDIFEKQVYIYYIYISGSFKNYVV